MSSTSMEVSLTVTNTAFTNETIISEQNVKYRCDILKCLHPILTVTNSPRVLLYHIIS